MIGRPIAHTLVVLHVRSVPIYDEGSGDTAKYT